MPSSSSSSFLYQSLDLALPPIRTPPSRDIESNLSLSSAFSTYATFLKSLDLAGHQGQQAAILYVNPDPRLDAVAKRAYRQFYWLEGEPDEREVWSWMADELWWELNCDWSM